MTGLALAHSYPAIRKTGRFTDLCMPLTLYHGTSRRCLSGIWAQGLRTDIPEKQSIASGSAVYLISDVGMAAHMARARGFRHNDEPVVLAINTSSLDADQIYFDINMSSRYWSQSIAYGAAIQPGAVTELPLADALRTDDHMILGDIIAGRHPVTFEMGWDRAAEFLQFAQLL